jgi:hypothetical protein
MRFFAEINSSNAAFTDDPHSELARILRELADKIERGDDGGKLRDVNGNSVGEYGVIAREDEDD